MRSSAIQSILRTTSGPRQPVVVRRALSQSHRRYGAAQNPSEAPSSWAFKAREKAEPMVRSLFEEFKRNRRYQVGLGAGVVIVGAFALSGGDDETNDPILGRYNPADREALSHLPTSKLISGWIVYAFCSSPTLIDWSEPLFNFLRKVPIVNYLVDDFARRTFFRQFFGAETAEEGERTVWTPLRRDRVGVLTAYNVEADAYGALNDQGTIDDCAEGTLEAIRSVGRFGMKHSTASDVSNGDTRCWIRTKVSGLITDPEIMVRASELVYSQRTNDVHWPGAPEDGDLNLLFNSPKLQASDREALKKLYGTLRSFMQEGQKYGVRVIMDAEQSWYQPACDVFTEELMREFNNGQGPPIVCASFQGYLRRNIDLIKSQLERARQYNYKLIFKQVRGAYMTYEHERWKRLGKEGPSPVLPSKAATDQSYNEGMRLALQAIKTRSEDATAPDVGVIFATHNEESVDNAIRLIEELELGTKEADGSFLISPFTANRVAFAQIYGMKDSLTNRIAGSIKSANGLPVVCKSAVYGSLQHALPNLSRRAAENKSVMEGRGGASSERKRLGREFCRRYIPFYSY